METGSRFTNTFVLMKSMTFINHFIALLKSFIDVYVSVLDLLLYKQL